MNDLKLANEIMRQLGAGRFIVMTGASNVAAVENGVAFKLPYKMTENGINHVKITLKNESDTYTIQFLKLTRTKLHVIREVSYVHCDQLQDVFTNHTGLYTSL